MSITRCPHCGTANRAGSNFCNGCGTDLRESQTLSDLAAVRDALSDPSTPDTPASEPPEPATDETTEGSSDALPTTSSSAPPAPSVTSYSGPPPDDTLGGQPWLRLEFVPDDEASHDLDLESETYFDDSGRLITGVQGLLTPIRIATNITDEMSQSYYRFADAGGPDTHNFGSTILSRTVALGVRYSFP